VIFKYSPLVDDIFLFFYAPIDRNRDYVYELLFD